MDNPPDHPMITGKYSNVYAYIYCLDCDPYPFCEGDCLDPCALEWSHYFGGDNMESDSICQNPINLTYASQPAAIPSIPFRDD